MAITLDTIVNKVFKVVKNGSWTSSWPGENYTLVLEDTADVTITFNPADNSIDVQQVSGGVVVPDTYVVAGVAGLCGSEWNATDENNKMTNEGGLYTKTYQNVAAGDYELKVVKNGSTWIGDSNGYNVFFTVTEACDVTVTYSENGGIQVIGDYITGYEPPSQTGDADMAVIGIVAILCCMLLAAATVARKKFF